MLVGRGSDEAIDLLTRAFCRAGRDAVLVCPPTFGMYAVARASRAPKSSRCRCGPTPAFALDERAVLERCTPDVKLVFLCSPNNPTGNLLDEQAIVRLAGKLAGRAVVVVDEAYMEFSTSAESGTALTQAAASSRFCERSPRLTGSPARAAGR